MQLNIMYHIHIDVLQSKGAINVGAKAAYRIVVFQPPFPVNSQRLI